MSVATPVITLVSNALAAWREYLKNRESIYKIHLHERSRRANNEAEKAFEKINEIISFVKPIIQHEDLKVVNEFNGFILELKRIKKRFNEYD